MSPTWTASGGDDSKEPPFRPAEGGQGAPCCVSTSGLRIFSSFGSSERHRAVQSERIRYEWIFISCNGRNTYLVLNNSGAKTSLALLHLYLRFVVNL